MSESSPLCNFAITLMQRVPPDTVVDSPPTARSAGLSVLPKFHVPFFALLARLVPPLYITSVAASAYEPTCRGASRLRSIRHPSGSVNKACCSVASHIPSKSCVITGDCSVRVMAFCPETAKAVQPNAATPMHENNFFRFIISVLMKKISKTISSN